MEPLKDCDVKRTFGIGSTRERFLEQLEKDCEVLPPPSSIHSQRDSHTTTCCCCCGGGGGVVFGAAQAHGLLDVDRHESRSYNDHIDHDHDHDIHFQSIVGGTDRCSGELELAAHLGDE